MERKKTIFDFLGNVFCMYGITMTLFILLVFSFGEDAKEISTLFGLGNKGLPLDIMAEFLLMSFFVTSMQYLFFSEKLFRHMSGIKRTVCMVLSILGITSLAIWRFGWFPMDMWEPWLGFFLSFLICFGVSVGIMCLKTKIENRRLEQGLERMKEKWKMNETGREN